jgi:putative heme iron utilization protein
MSPPQAPALRQLLDAQRVAALGTLHDGEPFVSMVPFALLPGGRFVVHVSGLAAHTQDMKDDPRVSLLVVASPAPDGPVHALARVTVRGRAARLAASSAEHAAAKQAYLERFPESSALFELGDFSLFEIAPLAARFIGGFAQARSLTAEAFVEALAPPG